MNRLAWGPIHGRRDLSRYMFAVSLLLASLTARAGDFSIGLGAGAEQGKTDCVAGYSCEHGSTHAKLFLGYRVTDGVELQGVFFDAGKFDGSDTSPLGTAFGGSFKVDGIGLAAGYRWSFMPGWSLKGQLGLASVRTRFDYAAPFSGDVSESTTQPLIGVSVGYDLTPNWRLSVDYDATRFKVHTTRGSLQMLGASAQYTF